MPNFVSFIYFLLNSITDKANCSCEFLMRSSYEQILSFSCIFCFSVEFYNRSANSLSTRHEEIVDKVLGHRQMKCKITWEIQPYFLSLRQEESREVGTSSRDQTVRVSNFVVPNLHI